MNREDIIQMAQEAQMPFYWRTGEITYLDKLEDFAALVAFAEREAVLDLVDGYAKNNTDLAEAIRARGQA